MTSGLRVNVTGALGTLALLWMASAPDRPVADAAMRGDREAVRELLKEGADVNEAQGDGMTALHWAADRADAELAEMLIQAGANVRAVTRIGRYEPLHLAAKAGSAPVLTLLLEAGGDVNATTTNSGATPLHFAAASGSADAVRLLLERGAEADAREAEWGQTPLIFAAALNRADAVRALLVGGADPSVTATAVDLEQESALDRAASQRRRQVLEAFGVGEDDEPTPGQVRAAAAAAREVYRTGEVPAREEEEGGRRPDAPVTSLGGLTPLLHAVRQGHMEATLALLEGGAEIDQRSGADGTTPLLMAVINGQFDLAMLLVERGADANLASELNGATPLFATVNSYWQPRTRFPQPKEHERQRATYLDVMTTLLAAGADPDARMTAHPWYMVYGGCGNPLCGLEVTEGATAFWRAAYAVDVEAMRLLVAWGADPLIPTKKPPYRSRTTRGGVFTEGEDSWDDPTGLPPIPVGGPGVYPLHAASGVGYGQGLVGNAHVHMPGGWLPTVKYLVEELGADVNQRDHFGYTPVHHAAARGDNELILYLVSRGADPTLLARTGQTTADMANGPVERVQPHPATVRLLEALGSKNNQQCQAC